MARDDKASADIVSQSGRLLAGQISRHSAAGIATVDRQKCEVNPPLPEPFDHSRIGDSIPAVVKRPRTGGQDQPDVLWLTALIHLDGFMGRRDCKEHERRKLKR